jgi:hypothetical protein
MNENERKILLKYGQQNLARSGYALPYVFELIFAEFFYDLDLEYKKILEFGPGRFEMAQLFQQSGASYCGVDSNYGIYQIGRKRGYQMFRQNFRRVKAKTIGERKYDGLFCRESINAFWFKDDDYHVQQVRQWCRMLKSGGWAWILSCNQVATDRLSKWTVCRILNTQIKAFESMGFRHTELTKRLARRYGQQKSVINYPLFTYNLPIPEV